MLHNLLTNYHQNGKKDDKFFPFPSCIGLATALVKCSDGVKFLAPENKITLKENICCLQKF